MKILAENSIFNQSLMRAANFLNVNGKILYDNKDIFNEFKRFEPDIFICYKENINDGYLRLFKKNKIKVFIISDQEINLDIENFQLIHQCENYIEKDIKSLFLPFGADTLLYKLGKVVDNLICDIVYDNPKKQHKDYIYKLIRDYNVRLFGDADNEYKILPQYLGFLTNELLYDVYSSSSFGLTFNSGNFISQEYYKIFSCGGLCLSMKDDIIYDKLNEFVVFFENEEEMKDKINFIKKQPNVRKIMINKSLKFVEKNSYIERIKQLLS